MKPGHEYAIDPAGMMRCCIMSLAQDRVKRQPGENVPCKFCKQPLYLNPEINTWVWDPKPDIFSPKI